MKSKIITYTKKVHAYQALLAFLLFTLCSTSINAQVLYSNSTFSGTYTQLTGAGITVINSNAGLTVTPGIPAPSQDDGIAIVNLPFTFNYCGNSFTEASFCTNGWVGMGAQNSVAATASRTTTNFFLPAIPNNTIAPWFRDAGGNFPITQPGTGPGSMRHGLTGTDIYTFQWDQTVGSSFSITTTNLVRFQASIYGPASSNPGRIEFLYGVQAGTLSSGAVLGIEDAIGGTNHFINALNGSQSLTTAATVWPGNGFGYRFDPLPPCITPASQPTALTFSGVTTSQINGSFTAAAGAPNSYLVVRYPAGSAVTDPANTTTYTVGQTLGLGTVVSAGASTAFSSPLLPSGTNFDFYVYSYNNVLCAGGPLYNLTITPGQNSGSQNTNSCGSMPSTITVGPTGTYPTLSGPGGALAAISTNGFSAPLLIELQNTYTAAGETYPITISFDACVSATNTLTIHPEATTASPLLISSGNTTATLNLDGARFVTIDGRPGGAGTSKFINIVNTSAGTGASGNAILLQNDANNNILTYLDLQASNQNPANNTVAFAPGTVPGVIAIGNTTVLNGNGNDNNTISFCDIHSAINVNVGIFAYNATAAGTVANNDNCVINGNNVYDWFHGTAASAGINISLGNNNWTVTNNAIYQPAVRTYTGTQFIRGMWITPNTTTLASGSGYNISNNFIGGSNANGTGVYTITGTSNYQFFGMDLSLGIGTTSSVQGNTITNMNITGGFSSNSAIMLNISNGNVNVGTATPNVIGSATQNGAIVFTTSASNGTFFGFRSGAGVTINFSNNIVSGIDLFGNNTTIAPAFNGIAVSGGTNITVSNNTIGSASLANSINIVSTSATTTTGTVVRGIICNSSATGATNAVTGNTIANINTNYSASGAFANTLVGISVTNGVATITGNNIYNLSSNSQTTPGGGTAAVLGIACSSTAPNATISGNTIHSLRLTNPTNLNITGNQGIYYSGSTVGTNVIEKNFIHSLSIASPASSLGYLTGIDLASGLVTVRNNMIRLGITETGANVTSPCVIKGIAVGNNNAATSIYFNSIYIGGSGVGVSTSNTFCYQRTGSSASDVRNNIFQNSRSNATTGGKHYAVILNNITSITMNNNDYYGTGTGYVFGAIGAVDFATYAASWIPGDVNSQVGNPQFIDATGALGSVNLHIHPTTQTVVEQNAINIASVTNDFDGQSRASLSPDDIGADAGDFAGFFCSAGPAGPVSAVSSNATPSCGIGTRILTLSGYTPLPGYTYQWQESLTNLPGSFVNVTGGTGTTTSTYTTAQVTATTYFQCVITCSFGGSPVTTSSVALIITPAPLTLTPASGVNVCSGTNVDMSASGADSYVWSCNPGVAGYNQNLIFFNSSPPNTPSITGRPTSTLVNSLNLPITTVPTPVWTYKVTATYLNGCTRQDSIVMNVMNSPVVPVVLSYSNSPDPVCAPGTPVTMTINNPGTVGAGQWIYNWYDATLTTLLQTTTNSASSNSYTTPVPVVNGNNVYNVKVSNTLCPSSYGIATPTHFVGYTSQNVMTNANCGDNGTIKIYPEGQNSYTNWYSNDFTTGLLGPAFDAATASFIGGVCTLTNGAQNQKGVLLVRNPAAINTNNLQVDFKLNTSIRTWNFGYMGADGMSWSYAPDVTPGVFDVGAENGSGSGIKVSFDAVDNSTVNKPGIYLMYNCNVNAPGASSPGVLAFKSGNSWAGLVDAPISITITQGGLLTLKVNNEIIFDHVALPPAYLAADKSTWLHAFTARSGGAGQMHALDDLNIRYNTYEYSINSTNGTNGTWQSSNSFNALPAATYPVWVRNPSNPGCVTNTGSVIIGTSLPPTNPITVAAPGYKTIICAGNSTNLTTDVPVPGAIFFWESSPNIGGPFTPAPGINSTEIYTTGPLTASTYFRFTSTCPSSSPVTSAPVLVSVNIGSVLSTNNPQAVNCVGNSATLTATPGPNTTFVWYNVADGGTALATGNSYVATPSFLPATYYIEPVTTQFTDHFDFGGEVTIGNLVGTTFSSTNISTKFTASSRIRIDSVKVFPTTAGLLTIALQNAQSASDLLTFSMTITTADRDAGKFINVPVNFTTPGAGSFQLTTRTVSCNYYSTYTGSYAAPFMSMGGVMQIIGGSTTPTGSNSTGMYGSCFNWSITTSCPSGFGARIPVTVTASPAFLISTTPSVTSNFCANSIQPITASSQNAYSVYTWSPIANLYADAAATIPLAAGNNQATVYFKAPTSGPFNFTVSTAGSGCTNTATASVSTIPAPTVLASATPNTICYNESVQLQSTASFPGYVVGANCGTGFIDISTTGTSIGLVSDETEFNITMPAFTFNSVVYTNARVGTNGNIVLGSTSGDVVFGNLPLPTVANSAGNIFLAPFWDDLDTDLGGTIKTQTVGTNFIIQYTGMNHSLFTAGDLTFQVQLDLVSGEIRFLYPDVITGNIAYDAGASATIGIQLNSTNGIMYSFNTASLSNGQCISFTTGSTGFTYDWSTNSNYLNDPSIANPIAQSMQSSEVYTLIVSDNTTGCTKTLTIPVNVLPLPVPSAFSNSPICENADILLFAFDGATYTWTGPDNYTTTGSVGDASIFGAQQINTGNYTVDVTGSNGCTASETIYIQVNDNPEPYIASMTEVSCTGFADGSFQVGVNGGQPFFSFNEQTQGQNFSGFFGGLTAGTYTVDVTDLNQCVSQFPLEIIVTTVPNAAPVIACPADIIVNSTPGLCGAIVNYTAPVGTDVCPVIGTSQIAGLASGWTFPVGTTVNTFRVMDADGVTTDCSFSVTVTENEAPTIVNCPASFSSCNPVTWTPPTITDNCAGLVINASHTPGNFPAGPTTVTYTATDAYNNVSTCSFVVTRYEESVAATSITSDRDFNNICAGENINLTINGGSTGFGSMWKWYTGSCAGTPLPAFNGMSSISVSPAVTTTYFARAEGFCNITTCVSITVVVSTTGPPNGILAITSMPAFGAVGVSGTVTCTPVPGATYYRWSSILGHINAIWFPPATTGPVETTLPSVNVLFNQNQSNYQIRVVAGNACGRTNNVSGHIRGTVPATTCLVGPALACPNTTATYSVASCQIPGSNGYQWAVTGNATITAGQGTHTITVSFGAGFTTGTVCVNGVSTFGLAGPQTCLTVSNNTVAPGMITGNDEPCESGFENYTIAPVAGATSYLWTTNIIGASANGTTTTGSVQFPAGPFSGQVCVQAVSGCGMSVATCFSVTSGVAGIPGPILGPESGICGTIGNYALTTNNANSYNWILPAGVTFASPNGSNSVQLQFPSAPGSHVITVEVFYDCGSATSTITVDGAPGTPTVTPATICAGGTDETYIASAAGADSYNWTTNGSAIYEQCTNPSCSNYYIIWDVPGGNFEVEAVNLCGVSAVPFSLSTNCRISEGGKMETKVYPNPTTGQLTVEFTSYAGGTYNMTVTDMSGRTVLTEDVKASSGNNEHKLNLENANPGMYMLYIKDGNGQISVTKVTVE